MPDGLALHADESGLIAMATVARRPSPLAALFPEMGLLAMVAAVASIPAMTAYGVWAGVQAMKASWAIRGPPCPIVAAPSLMGRGPKPPVQFH